MPSRFIKTADSFAALLKTHGHLWVLVPPVLVFLCASILFEFTVPGAPDFAQAVHSAVTGQDVGVVQVLDEARGRYFWFSTVLLMLFVAMYAVAVCAVNVYQNLAWPDMKLVLAAGLAILLISLASPAISAKYETALSIAVYDFTFAALRGSGRFADSFLVTVSRTITLVNVLAAIVPPVILISACGSLVPAPVHRADDPQYFVERMRCLRDFLNASSAFLVAGILHMAAWLHWATTLVAAKEPRLAAEGLAHSISLYWGATFTVLIISAYVPAANTIRTRVLHVIRAKVQDPSKWLTENGFSRSPAQQLPQIMTMLAPLMAGQIGSLIGALGGSVGN